MTVSGTLLALREEDAVAPGAGPPAAPPTPSGALLPPDEAPEPSHGVVRYERGSRVYARDGAVGTLRQVVIDEDLGEVKALVVHTDDRHESVLVPPDLIESGDGDAIHLTVTRQQFARGASRSPRFDPRMFTAADVKRVAGMIPLLFQGDPRRSVVDLSADFVETSDSRASIRHAPAERAPAWKRFWRR